jgi:hypothetical protein
MSTPEAAAPAFDRLLREGAITGYTIEQDAGYLRPSAPTLTYRMYRHGAGAANAGRLGIDMLGLGAEVRWMRAAGNLQDGSRIQRSAQVTVIASFPSQDALDDALLLVRTRYHAGGTDPVPGSWRWPDVRVTGCRPPMGMAAVVAQWGATSEGTAVALTLAGRRLLPHLDVAPVLVLDEWLDLLTGAHAGLPAGIGVSC